MILLFSGEIVHKSDTIIIQQVASVPSQKTLVADDIDVFVLLLHFCHYGNITPHVMMVSPIQDRVMIDINATGLACYGQSKCHTMTEARQKVWTLKVGQSIAGVPKLVTLPPTNEAFGENVARAHLQVATVRIWKQALESESPSLQPNSCGWDKIV